MRISKSQKKQHRLVAIGGIAYQRQPETLQKNEHLSQPPSPTAQYSSVDIHTPVHSCQVRIVIPSRNVRSCGLSNCRASPCPPTPQLARGSWQGAEADVSRHVYCSLDSGPFVPHFLTNPSLRELSQTRLPWDWEFHLQVCYLGRRKEKGRKDNKEHHQFPSGPCCPALPQRNITEKKSYFSQILLFSNPKLSQSPL